MPVRSVLCPQLNLLNPPKKIPRYATAQMTIWRIRVACWIPNATNTHSEYLILIAFPLQQWLHERPSVSCYTYVACLLYSWRKGIATLTMHQRWLHDDGECKSEDWSCRMWSWAQKKGAGCAQHQDRVVISQVTRAWMIKSMDEIILSDNYRSSSPAAISSLMGGQVRWLH